MAEGGRHCQKRQRTEECRRIARQAAKDRRDQESDILAELKAGIPVLKESNFTQIDRVAQLRLACALIRLREYIPQLTKTVLKECNEDSLWSEELVSRCLDGFIIICDDDGVILYTTENVAKYLGFAQIDMIGHVLGDFVDRNEYEELKRAVSQREASKAGHLIFMHMKCLFGPQGRKLSWKSAFMKPVIVCLRTLNDKSTDERIWLLLGTAAPVGSGSLYNEVASHYSSNGSFATRHTYDMKFSYVDESVKDYLNLEAKELIGTSFYNLIHPEDLLSLVKSFKALFKKMHCRTPYYRLLGGDGVAVWIQTEAGAVSTTSHGRPRQYVMCIHKVLGKQWDIYSDSNDADIEAHSSIPATALVGINAFHNDCFDIQSQPSFCGKFPQFSRSSDDQKKWASNTVQAAKISRRIDSYNEILQWLTSDLPDSPPSDLDVAMPEPTGDALVGEQQQQPIIQSQQPCSQIAIYGDTMENSYRSDEEAMENTSLNTAMTNCQLPNFNGIDVESAEFVYPAIINQTQYQNNNYENMHSQATIVEPDTDFYGDVTEKLVSLAPFVAEEEMLPLDMEGLMAGFNMDDWFEPNQVMNSETNRPLVTPPPLLF